MDSNATGSAYRRGLVLGLTLAEIFLLILFLLLLVFAYLLGLEEEKWEPIKEVIEEANLPAASVKEMQSSVVEIASRLESYAEVREALPNADTMIATLSDFAALRERLREDGVDVDDPEALKSRLAEMSDAQLIASEYEDVCGNIETLKALLESDFVDASATDALRTCPPTRASFAPESEPETLDQAKAMVARLQRTNAGLNDTLTELSEGRGLVYPPCWATMLDPRKPHYIYNVTILDEGVQVSAGDAREGQDQSLFQSGVREPTLDTELSRNDFLRQTRAIFDWSVANQCRFFVRIYDQSSPDNKDGYKRQLATVESHFYKYLIR